MDEFLTKMIAHVEQQYNAVEKECSILRTLLKPWPKKKQLVQENLTQVDVKQTAECEKEENNHLNPDEKLALQKMDRLLGRAQKALKIKEKIMVSERSGIADSERNNSKEAKKGDNNVVKNETCGSYISTGNIRNEDKNSDDKDDVSLREKVLAKKKEIKKNPPQTSLTKELKSSSSNSISSNRSSRDNASRPSSVTSRSRPSSSKSRYTPAHINAPFKTEENTKVAHRKLNHIYKNHLSKPSHKKNNATTVQKQTSLTNGLKTLPKIASTTKKEICISSDHEDKELQVCDNNSNVGNETPSVSNCTEIVAEATACAKSTGEIYDPAKCFQNVDSIISPSHVQECVSSTTESHPGKQEALFSLTDKSSKIKVPPKLNKLVAENHALLEKCATAKLVKKMPDADAAQNFIDRLNGQNEVSPELWARAKAMTCLQSHSLMLKSLHSLELGKLSEATPFETVYKGKKLLEFILSKFAQTQNEADYFSRVQFRHVPSNGLTSTVASSDTDVIMSSFSNQGNESSEHWQKDRIVQDALRCSKLWTQLEFEKHLYLVQKHLLSLSEAEWWDVLSNDPQYCSIFQMTHSLLTSSGEFFPAIVQNPYS